MSGWNRPGERKVEEKGGGGQWNVHLKGFVAGVIVVAGAAVAAWLLWPTQERGEDAASTTSTSRIKEVTPAKSATNRVVTAVTQEPAKASERDTNVVWISKNRYIMTCADGSKCTIYVPQNRLPGAPAPTFESGLNNFLVNYLVPGVDVPPTPVDYNDAAVMKALMEKIVVSEEDDEEVRFQKESVLELREQLRDYIKEGKTVKDFLADLQHRQEMEADYMRTATDMIYESLAKDSAQEAKETYDALNKHLEEKGLPKVRLPRKIRKALEEQK